MEGDEGEAKLQAAANWRASALFSEEERLALDYAERMTITGQGVDDTLFAQLKARFSEAQIVELTAAVALENFRSKFNPALGIEAQGFCLLPQRYGRETTAPGPLPAAASASGWEVCPYRTFIPMTAVRVG